MRKKLWEAIIAVAVEESVRNLLPPLLPYVWLVILLGLTWEVIPQERAVSAYAKVGSRKKMISYALVAVVGAALAVFYWWGISKVFAGNKKREHEAHIEMAKDIAASMPPPPAAPPITKTVVQLAPEQLHVSDKIAAKVIKAKPSDNPIKQAAGRTPETPIAPKTEGPSFLHGFHENAKQFSVTVGNGMADTEEISRLEHGQVFHPLQFGGVYPISIRLDKDKLLFSFQAFAGGSQDGTVINVVNNELTVVTCPHPSRTKSYDGFRLRFCG